MGIENPVSRDDYMVDYYAVLGLEPGSSQDEIDKALKGQLHQYHPDKNAGPAFKSRAEQRTRILYEAQNTLLDPEARQAYDLRLSGWDGYISKDGIPPFGRDDLAALFGNRSDEYPGVAFLLAQNDKDFDEKAFEKVEALYRKYPDDEEVRYLYRDALANLDTNMGNAELILRQAAGLNLRDPLQINPPRAYLTATQAAVDQGRQRMLSQLDQQMLQLQSGDLPMLGAGEESESETPANAQAAALAIYRESAVAYFNQYADEIEAMARKREAVMEKRLSLVEGTYMYDQQLTAHPIVCITFFNPDTEQDETFWWPPRRWENNELVDAGIDMDELVQVSSREQAQKYIDQGYTFIHYRHENGLPVAEEYDEVVKVHLKKWGERGRKK